MKPNIGLVRVHHTAVIEGDVQLADGVEVGPFCYLRGPLIIGPGTRLWPHVVIGTEGEHRRAESVGVIRIGARVTLREFVVIQRGTGDRDTEIGDGAMLMDRCHVGHDSVIGQDVTMSPQVVLGGHTRVHRGATIGISAMTHQHSTVGAYAMVGMGSVVTRDVPPFVTVAGNPARFLKLNAKGIEAARLGAGDVVVERGAFNMSDRASAYMTSFMRDVRRPAMSLHPAAARHREGPLGEQHGGGPVLGRGE